MGTATSTSFEYIRVSASNLNAIGAFIVHPNEIGNDGLTDSERALHLSRFRAGIGRAPQPSRERRERLAALELQQADPAN